MYAKLVRHVMESDQPVLADGGDAEVVPREHIVLEGKRLRYRKYMGVGGPRAILDEHDLNGEILFGFDEEQTVNRKTELIHLTVDSEQYVAVNCQLYVMNEAGKTIDSMCCLQASTSQS